MDFNKKDTTWVHMNLEALAPKNVYRKGDALRFFAELYLGDDDKYVLATLSVAEPSDVWCGGKWKKEYLGRECCVCPDDIRHPWHGFRYGFNCPPIQMAPNLRAMAKGMECNGILQG